MLSKNQRLNLRLIELSQFFKQANKFNTSYFNAAYRWLKLNSQQEIRIAVVVPKKVSLKAVERNRIKRLVYNLLKAKLKKIKTRSNYQLQVIIFTKSEIKQAQPEQLAKRIDQLINKVSC